MNSAIWELSANCDLGAVRESYLSNLGETIFGYELLTCGEVVYGDPEIVLARARIADKEDQPGRWLETAGQSHG